MKRLEDEPDTVAAAIKAFGFEVQTTRDRVPAFVRSYEALASASGVPLGTAKNAGGGTQFPTKTTIVKIAKACRSPELVATWDAVNAVVNPNSPRYGEAWPARPSAGGTPDAPTDEPSERAGSTEAGHDSENSGPKPAEASVPPWRRPVVIAIAVVVVVGGGATAVLAGGSGSTPKPEVHFNSLGGTSTTYIEVYRGPLATENDRMPVGGYKSGDTALAVCKKEGRLVKSHPEDGEQARSSTTWVRLDGQLQAYATMTYADMDPLALAQLPQC